jgi:hypothetical protein
MMEKNMMKRFNALLCGVAFCFLVFPAWGSNSWTIIYSGNLDGELEPCGCSDEGNLGGIKRRATLLAQLRNEVPDLVAVSSGGLLGGEGAGDDIKSKYILQGFATLGYDAIGVQWRDLSFGSEFVQREPLAWVASNWHDQTFAAQKLVRRKGQTLAFFSWLNPEESPMRQMQGQHRVVKDDIQSLHRQLAEAKGKGYLTVLAITQPAEQFAKHMDLDSVDILLEESGYEVYAEPRKLGKTLVLKPGSRGMRLGRLDIQWEGGHIVEWKRQVLPMPESMPDAPQLAEWYAAYNAEVKANYLKRVEMRKLRESGESPYVGEEACQDCHQAQYKVWSESDHAVAYDDLEAVGKSFDPECLQCHTVGFDKPGGYFDFSITGHLIGVQCESCHGAGRVHVEKAGAAPLGNSGWSAQQMCAQCHVQKHSPGFDFSRYWPKIEH